VVPLEKLEYWDDAVVAAADGCHGLLKNENTL
jgi:hypothetical protein